MEGERERGGEKGKVDTPFIAKWLTAGHTMSESLLMAAALPKTAAPSTARLIIPVDPSTSAPPFTTPPNSARKYDCKHLSSACGERGERGGRGERGERGEREEREVEKNG